MEENPQENEIELNEQLNNLEYLFSKFIIELGEINEFEFEIENKVGNK